MIKFFIFIILVLSVSVFPTSFAESTPDIFVQIIHRDSSGNLLAYLQSDKMIITNLDALNYLLETESSLKQDPIYEINDKKLQVISRQSIQTYDYQTIIGNTQLFVDVNGIEFLAAEFFHDGFIIGSGDTITTIWNFSRFV